MRRLWETIGGIALAIVAVSCSNDSASHGCESPCEEPDAQAVIRSDRERIVSSHVPNAN